MAFYGYNDNWSTATQPSYPYPGSYDHFDETEYSFSTHNSDNLFTYPDPIDYHSSLHMNYSVYNYTNPEIHKYDPSLYFSSEIKFSVSYSTQELNEPESTQEFDGSGSTQEFNEPEFEEYDPTPYGGGYDPVATYGPPLPPSDETCYPRTVPKSDDGSLNDFSYGSIPSPYVTNDEPLTSPPNCSSDRPDPEPEFANRDQVLDIGSNGDYAYDVKMVPQSMHGSGLEAIDICDICESIFGYWPCLAKIEQQKREKSREICDQESRSDPWKIAADYLFGNPVVYNYDDYHY